MVNSVAAQEFLINAPNTSWYNVRTALGVCVVIVPDYADVSTIIAGAISATGMDEDDAFELAYDGETLQTGLKITAMPCESGAVLDLLAMGTSV